MCGRPPLASLEEALRRRMGVEEHLRHNRYGRPRPRFLPVSGADSLMEGVREEHLRLSLSPLAGRAPAAQRRTHHAASATGPRAASTQPLGSLASLGLILLLRPQRLINTSLRQIPPPQPR